MQEDHHGCRPHPTRNRLRKGSGRQSRRIARSLASAGAAVVINGFGKADEIKYTLEGLQRETGSEAVYSTADMTKPDEIASMVSLALESFGRLDILVNNAGIQHVSPIDQFPVEK
jgi:3-hydroxybutyrate dehydrogenase